MPYNTTSHFEGENDVAVARFPRVRPDETRLTQRADPVGVVLDVPLVYSYVKHPSDDGSTKGAGTIAADTIHTKYIETAHPSLPRHINVFPRIT